MVEFKFTAFLEFGKVINSMIYAGDFESALKLVQRLEWNKMLPREDCVFLFIKIYRAEKTYKGWFKDLKSWQDYLNEQDKPF